jgi:hypothetical protein
MQQVCGSAASGSDVLAGSTRASGFHRLHRLMWVRLLPCVGGLVGIAGCCLSGTDQGMWGV